MQNILSVFQISQKKKLLENYDVDEKKISVIHLGVKKNNFSLVKNKIIFYSLVIGADIRILKICYLPLKIQIFKKKL